MSCDLAGDKTYTYNFTSTSQIHAFGADGEGSIERMSTEQ
jgi:hypothetical protein